MLRYKNSNHSTNRFNPTSNFQLLENQERISLYLSIQGVPKLAIFYGVRSPTVLGRWLTGQGPKSHNMDTTGVFQLRKGHI